MPKTTQNIQGQPTNYDRFMKKIFPTRVVDKSQYTYVKVEGAVVPTWKEVKIKK